jgi:dihydrofolate reductase
MSKVIAAITTSVDGYVTGPGDGPDAGLGVGGERLHYWVMGGPWTYDGEHGFAMSDADKAFFDPLVARIGGGIVGRGMYDAAGGWGGRNPFPGTLVVLTHHLEDQPDPANGFHFVDGFDHALACARADAGDKDISIGGGADVIRQALRAGVVDELVISTAPVILGAGKRLFDGFTEDVDLRIRSVHPSEWAVHTTYDVVR